MCIRDRLFGGNTQVTEEVVINQPDELPTKELVHVEVRREIEEVSIAD